MKEHEKLLKAVRDEIERSVNGGIRAIDKKLDDYIKEDTEWKDKTQPAIDNMTNLSTAWKMVLGFLVSLGAIAGSILGVKKLLGL